jgi:hypothetical protein
MVFQPPIFIQILFFKTLLVSLIGMAQHGVPTSCWPLSSIFQHPIDIFD